MFKLFQTQIDNLDVLTQPSRFRHKRSWAQGIKSLLDNLGFSQMWHNQYVEIPCYEVLGPLLFLLYINDLPQNIQSQVRLFAYDTAVYLTVNSHEAANTLQADLDTLQEWELTWDMEFNPGKCQVMHITKSKVPFQSQYTLHGQTLESVDSAKYLGVTISQDLTGINTLTTSLVRQTEPSDL